MNGVQQVDSETSKVPVGPRGPLLNRRGINLANNKGLGQTHPKAPERPEPSGGGEVELVSAGVVVSHGKEKRHDWEQEREDVAADVATSKKTKRGYEEEEAEAAEEEEDGEAASLWLWNGKAEGGAAKDGAEGFRVTVQAKSHIKGDRASRKAGGDADDSRWKFKKRETHQGGVNGLNGVDEWAGLPERRLTPSKKRALDATHQKNGVLEKRRFRKWNFKRGEEGGKAGSEGEGEGEGEVKIEFEKRRWHW